MGFWVLFFQSRVLSLGGFHSVLFLMFFFLRGEGGGGLGLGFWIVRYRVL